MTAPMKCCGNTPWHQTFNKQFRCLTCGISGPYNGPDHVGWDALMGGSGEPKDGVVRVRIPVHYAAARRMIIHMQYRPDKGWRDVVATPFEPHVVITADIPLPTPADVKGEVS